MLDLPAWLEGCWYSIPWLIFALSSADILLKYKKIDRYNLGLFLRTHWLDLIMLIPFLFIFKVAKTGKSWLKLSQLVKKILFTRKDKAVRGIA